MNKESTCCSLSCFIWSSLCCCCCCSNCWCCCCCWWWASIWAFCCSSRTCLSLSRRSLSALSCCSLCAKACAWAAAAAWCWWACCCWSNTACCCAAVECADRLSWWWFVLLEEWWLFDRLEELVLWRSADRPLELKSIIVWSLKFAEGYECNFCSCTPDLFVRRTCYFCDVKTKYWNWSETLDIVVPVGLLLAVAVAKKWISC